jgi:phosphoribosyl-AMP cyclohydrolase
VNFPSEIQERFLKDELVAAIAQESSTGQVLMLAWMNQEALEKTIQTNQVTYWSRSRNSLWVKGETSGNSQELISISFDCDGDAILLKVHQQGAACHTGERSCFHRELNS